MERIQDLYDELEPVEFKKLMSADRVTVYQKVDGCALIAKKEDGKMKFFNRSFRDELTPERRVIFDLYEQPIKHLEQNSKNLLDGTEIHVEYCDPDRTGILSYPDLGSEPAIFLNFYRDMGRTIVERERLKKMAESLNVYPPVCHFENFMDRKSVDLLSEYLSMSEMQKFVFCSGNDFNKFLSRLFNSDFSSGFLGSDRIEGVVLSLIEEDIFFRMFKLVDPLYEAEIKTKLRESRRNSQQKNMFCAYVSYVISYFRDNYSPELVENITKHEHGVINKISKLFSRALCVDLLYLARDIHVDFRFSWDLVPSSLREELRDASDSVKSIYYILFKYFTKQHSRMNPAFGSRENMLYVNAISSLLTGAD